MGTGGLARSRWIRTGILAWLAVAFSGTEVPGYRFYLYNVERGIPLAAEAVHWDESVWGPGETLTWVVADDPGWTAAWTDSTGARRQPPLGSPDEVVPFVRTALQAWSDVGTADTLWEVSGVDPALDHAESKDGRPTVFVDPEADRGSYAAIWFDRVDGAWTLVDCDVPLAPFAAAALRDDIWWTHVLVHEFGHCIGLDHSGAFPRINEGRQLDLRGAFGVDPLMSYGDFYGDLAFLAADDRLGASLLRPAAGWKASMGGISGLVTVGEDPAPFVQVFAIPVSGGVTTGAVGSFTNADGEFVVDGLEPGRYVLWTGPLNILYAHGELLSHRPSPVLDASDQALLVPVTVTRGAVTEGIRIGARATRKP